MFSILQFFLVTVFKIKTYCVLKEEGSINVIHSFNEVMLFMSVFYTFFLLIHSPLVVLEKLNIL